MEKKEGARECRYCHFTFSEFTTKGWLGCPNCYDEFREDIDRILQQMHGSSVHTGKRYAGHAADNLGDEDVNRLTAELSRAIKREEYEMAAVIRDKIRRQCGPGALVS
jgi:protein arginine kinase activator